MRIVRRTEWDEDSGRATAKDQPSLPSNDDAETCDVPKRLWPQQHAHATERTTRESPRQTMRSVLGE
jgi:hypothetical protein